MRTIGFRSNILFAIAAAFGVVAALGQPWYGVAEPPTSARMEDLFAGIGRAFSVDSGVTGWDALETADSLIAGLAIGTVLLSLLTLMPQLQYHVQPVARWSALATFATIFVKLVDQPESAMMSEPRQGLMIALGSAAVLVASTMTVAAAPVRRRPSPRPYIPPAPPEYTPEASHGPQQY